MAAVIQTGENTAIQVYSPKRLLLIGVCFILSGATALIYEVLWARMLGLVFGATTPAVSTVLAAFMGGLALGSALAGRIGGSLRRPVRVYGLLEISVALYAISVPLLFSLIDSLYPLIWQRFHPGFFTFTLWRFALSCALLLIPTTLMGATLPVLSAALLPSPAFKPTSVTRLYTGNLAGAICGVIAAGFFLLPAVGVRATIYTAAVINMIIGVVAIFADRANQAAPINAPGIPLPAALKAASGEGKDLASAAGKHDGEAKFWLFCALVSGFVTISTQVAWTRVLTMIIGSSTYAFSIVVALFLTGLSGGAYVVGRSDCPKKLRRTMLKVELVTALSLFLSLYLVNWIPGLLVNAGLALKVGSWAGLLTLQILSAALLILLPAFCLGTVMPLVLIWASERQRKESVELVGRSYAVNTIGAIAGALGAGFVLIPNIGTKYTIVVAAALCVTVAGLAYQPRTDVGDRDLRRALAVGATVLLGVVLFIGAPRMNLADLSIGAYDNLIRELAKTRATGDDRTTHGPVVHQLLMYEEGPTATVSVRRDWDSTSMAINGRTNASDVGDMPTQVMLGQLPLLLAPSARNGLVVGFASGVTVGAMLQSSLELLECVELEPATIRGSRYFEHVNNHPLSDSRLRLIIDDARTYLRVTPTRYDMIVSEPSHPWVPGVANLFTQEFFELGRERLSDSGIFVQWVQIYQLSTESLQSVLATFQKVFPQAMIFRVGGTTKGKDLIVVGSKVPLTLARLGERMSEPRIAAELARVGIKTEADIRAWYVCDETQFAPAVAGAVINTDDNMHIENAVPREAFLPLMQTNAAWIEMLATKRPKV
jgi:spermidine synthase